MHNKMAINTHLSTIESKNQTNNKKNRDKIMDGYEEHFDGCQMGGCCMGMDDEVRVLRSANS